MATAEAIKAKYKKAHDELTERFYQRHELSKADFDAQHGATWTGMDAELLAGGFTSPSVPIRDLAAELDQAKTDIQSILARLGI